MTNVQSAKNFDSDAVTFPAIKPLNRVNSMPTLQLHQFATFLTGVALFAVGVLGLTSSLSIQTVLMLLILTAVSLVSFYVGQISAP